MKKYRALVMDFDLTIADACEIIAGGDRMRAGNNLPRLCRGEG